MLKPDELDYYSTLLLKCKSDHLSTERRRQIQLKVAYGILHKCKTPTFEAAKLKVSLWLYNLSVWIANT